VSKTVLESLKCKNCILLYNPNKNTFGYKGNKTSSDFVVASIGSLIPIKGFEYVIEAARMRPKINFRIYGIGELYEQLSKDAPENVRFMGFCNDVISELYADVDIVVVPTFIQEALSLVIVESKSVGLPVICTNIGGQSEIVSDGVDGYKVPIKDSSAIAEKIDLLSRDLSLYNKISSNAFKNSYLFSYEIFTEKLNQIFE
jgi:glycosyltransferase involved in cell wall biosynthesis